MGSCLVVVLLCEALSALLACICGLGGVRPPSSYPPRCSASVCGEHHIRVRLDVCRSFISIHESEGVRAQAITRGVVKYLPGYEHGYYTSKHASDCLFSLGVNASPYVSPTSPAVPVAFVSHSLSLLSSKGFSAHAVCRSVFFGFVAGALFCGSLSFLSEWKICKSSYLAPSRMIRE